MMTHAALDAGPARLAGLGCLRVDQFAAGDELRFAIHDDEHVVGVVVQLGAAPHDALGDDDQALILDDAPALDEGGRNLVVVYVVDALRKTGGSCQGGSREYCGECDRVFHEWCLLWVDVMHVQCSRKTRGRKRGVLLVIHGQFPLMFAALIIGHHFSISLF
jgi:hypothetical protein